MCYNAVMEKKLYQCLDAIEICGRKLKCRFDINNWHVMHNHDFWEIMIVTEGTYPQILNGEKLIMQKNAALLLKPSDVHIVQPSSPNDSHINIVINVDFMKEVCDFFDPNLFDALSVAPPQVLYLSASQFRNISDIAHELQLYPLDEQPERLKRLLLSFYLNLYQLRFHLKSLAFPEEFKKLFRMISLPENITISVQELAESTGFSYSHFSKLFKEITGMTANEYLTKNKMEYAAYALTKLKTPVLNLSLDLGFSSLGYFSSLFKKFYGVSPLQYKKMFSSSPTKIDE